MIFPRSWLASKFRVWIRALRGSHPGTPITRILLRVTALNNHLMPEVLWGKHSWNLNHQVWPSWRNTAPGNYRGLRLTRQTSGRRLSEEASSIALEKCAPLFLEFIIMLLPPAGALWRRPPQRRASPLSR